MPRIHADCIVVANDRVAEATFQRVLMEAAVPKGIRVLIRSVEESARIFVSGELEGRRVLLLFATSADALEAHRLGLEFPELNLGNMHAGAGKMRFSCTISLDGSDIENLKRLEADGVRIVSQCLPSDRERGWRKLMPAEGG